MFPDSTSTSPTLPVPCEDDHIDVYIWGPIVGTCVMATGAVLFILAVVVKKRKNSGMSLLNSYDMYIHTHNDAPKRGKR